MNYLKKIGLSLSVFILGATTLHAQKLSSQELEAFKKTEDSLVVLVDSIRGAIVLDERVNYSYELIQKLRHTLNRPNSYLFPFDKLKERMHILNAPDGSFKIFNWVVANSNFKKTYNGVIQTSTNQLIPLLDYSEQLDEKKEQTAITNNKEWYGAEYYNIIKDQYQGQTVYLLLGFNSNSSKYNRKFIDVLTIKDNKATFGAPMFRVADLQGNIVIQNRFIQYYKKNATTMLNWDTTLSMIVFTRLESEINAPSRLDTYIPAGPIDGLKKVNDLWIYKPSVLNILQLQDGRAPIDGVMN